MAQWRRGLWRAASGLALAVSVLQPARGDSAYVGDMPIAASDGGYVNSGATVWTGAHDYGDVSNPAGASILNEGAASGAITANGGVVRNAPGATWSGDLAIGANVAGAEVVNQGQWSGALNNAGGGLDNSGSVTSVNNAAGVFANEGVVSGALVNGGQAANSGKILGGVVNASNFVNNATGAVAGGLVDSGAATNNGAITGGVRETGAFVNNASGVVTGGFALNAGSAVDNGVLAGKVAVGAGTLIVNAAGAVQGHVANAGVFDNAGAIHGAVVNAGTLVNAGVIDGFVRETAGQATNNGTIKGDAAFLAGVAVNNGAIGGDVKIGAAASVIDNGAIAGVAVNQGAFTENAAGVIEGALLNRGRATIDGDLAGGAVNAGQLVVNASGRVENGLETVGGATTNAGRVTGGAVVRSGVLVTTGEIDGGLRDAGLVKASGTLSGPITVTGALVVGDGTPDGARLTLAPGATVSGVVTMPVDFSTGRSNFLSAPGAALGAAKLALTGNLVNATGAYWGAMSLSDTPIALTDAAKAALLAASGPLYTYSDPLGTGVTQTINPGLGATASQAAVAAATALIAALGPAPSDFERAPADPTPNLGAGSVWSRGFGAALTLSGDNSAGTGPAFDATRLSARLAGAEAGVEYGLHNIQNSGLSVSVGLAGGDAGGRVADAAGSGAVSAVSLPFVGAYAALNGLGFTGRIEARYVHIDMTLTDAPLAVFGQAQRASGMIYSAEAAYRIPAGYLYVEPSAGFSLAHLAIADERTDVGDLAFGDARLTLGQVGLKVGGDFVAGAMAWRPYALASLSREWLGGGAIGVPQGPTITPTGLSGFEQVGLGLSASLARSGVSGFAQGAWAFGPKLAGLTAMSGLRFEF